MGGKLSLNTLLHAQNFIYKLLDALIMAYKILI
jgi:hypothetical protein